MKKIILDFESKRENFKELIHEALNNNFIHFLISKETVKEFEKIERSQLYSRDLNIPSKYLIYADKKKFEENLNKVKYRYKNSGFFINLNRKDDEKEIIELSKTGNFDFILVSAKDWMIIPFENLIAEMHSNDTDLIALVDSIKEAKLVFNILEIGVDGILFKPNDIDDISKLKNMLQTEIHIDLTIAKITNIQHIPEAERVCVDSTSLLNIGEGFLVGSTAKGFCLIHSETIDTEFVSPRPFRVNAGDVSSYILVPDDDLERIYRTKYLSELKGGDRVLAVTYNGEARIVSIGRVKIETRPMLRFELEVLHDINKLNLSCICQNAETIRLVDSNGKAKSVVDVNVGDNVLVHIGRGATHFGKLITESIIEK
ncbi:MAG: 3-dehydroquinate synthase II [Candidatus Hodarchaeota archaeon]